MDYKDLLENLRLNVNRRNFAGGTGSDEESYGDLIDAYEKGILVLPGETLTEYINRIRKINQKANGGRIGLEQGTTKLEKVYGKYAKQIISS
jgi:hypothetical protein